LKWFRERRMRVGLSAGAALMATCVCVGAAGTISRDPFLLFEPGHGFARWIENVQAGSDLENALYRMMPLPGGEFLFRRSPHETVPALTAMEQTQKAAALFSLRALEEEQSLDFNAAEADWKRWAEQAQDRVGAHLDLADFYERRMQPQAELAALKFVGEAASDANERWTAVESQRSWTAWQRALKVADEFALPRNVSEQIFAGWVKRYPQEPSAYERQFAFLLDGKEFGAATDVIARYKNAFPADRVFPVKAEAELAAKRGKAADGLAVYEARFEPLWPADLVKSYFDLVLTSHAEHTLSDGLRAKLAANPDDLKDAARLFYLYQQQGQLDSAKAVLARFREQKETRGAQWSTDELDTLETLYEGLQDFQEAARYAYALASDRAAQGSERKGLVALTRILLTAPEQPLRVGAGNLALYKNIATMDRGPGYLNGILSLLLNTQGPSEEYADEDQRAVPYFHRARAAELLAQIDQRFADEPDRPQLHGRLMEAYAAYGDDAQVIREGTAILAQFPQFGGREQVALELADAYARTKQTEKEFAVYQDLLKELAAQAEGVPLGGEGAAYSKPVASENSQHEISVVRSVDGDKGADGEAAVTRENAAEQAAPRTGIRSAQYAQVLNRYLSRLVTLQRLQDALTVLRGELDRNPNDPGLYQKLADFLVQNALNAHEEEVFERAIQQFQDPGWYAKLARFYLRQRRTADYSALMRKVTGIFSGTELEQFLQQAPAPNRSLALEVDLYAHERFPHDLRFAESLIGEYERTRRDDEVDKLLWAHWAESPQLRDQLFERLSMSGKLDAQIETLRQQSPEIDKSDWSGLATRNPGAERFWLEACIWQSHFEQGVDAANALAAEYPADAALGDQASSLYRSLAYFHAEDTDKAVAIQKRLLDAEPGNLETLARIGDIYADRGRFGDAAPYWVRMAEVRPGEANGYLQSATVFWDYFDFASADAELEKGRMRLSDPTLFGYQAGAIDESRGDTAGAVRAYTASATAATPSAESRDRLLALARRPAQHAAIEEGTGGLLKSSAPTPAGIQLRGAVLEAEHRKDDLRQELKALIAQTGSFDVLDAVTAAARSHALPDVEESALWRQIALTTDPVRNLQLRYQLVDLLQPRNAQAAAQEVDAIYREHGKVLGVVRSTVDYDWGHDRKPQAIVVLLESAQVAYPELKSRFELEAAQKLTDTGDTARAHTLLATLLGEKPLDAGYETAMAQNFARASDQAGLESFYEAQLDLVRKASLEHDEKQQRVAQLRRGMIGAGTMLSKYDDAVDQYIELINAYPEDAALTQEAALFAIAHGGRDRLFDFYKKAIAESPRDPRWSIVLARLATAGEDDALAIDAYGKAMKLRPERQDLYIAQGELEERLHRLDDAIVLYSKLYTLSYRDPKWMEKVAELSARKGRNADAVKALETGWIEGRPAKAANSFAVAERLEQWGLLDDAKTFAERGVEQAGADLLVSEQSGATTYARIMARLRQSTAANARLVEARRHAADISVSTVAQQVIKDGPGAITTDEWRKQREEQRNAAAANGFAQAVRAIGEVVGGYYTPEEKAQFAAWIKDSSATASDTEIRSVILPAADAAKLTDLTAELEWDLGERNVHGGSGGLSEWVELEKRRVQADGAAARLEKLAPSVPARLRGGILRLAIDTYRDSGDTVGELRTTELLAESTQLQPNERARYYRLLLAQRPQDMIALASTQDSAAQYLVRNGSADQALSGIAARATSHPPVWKSAYLGLTGLYLSAYRPEINSAFATALNADATIGERVSKPVDRNQAIAGEVWFYYGSRYGEYLDEEKDARSDDFLEAELEHTPESSDAYLRLANYSADKGRGAAALADYQHSLDLRRGQPAVLNSIATLDWNENRHDDALAAWSEAVKLLADEMDARHVPETFWDDFKTVIGNISAHGQYESVRQPVEAMLRRYIARNGDYRVEPLLEAGYHANKDSVDWLLAISAGASHQESVLNSVLPNRWSTQGGWIRKNQISRILEHIVELAQRDSQANAGQSDEIVDAARLRYVEALIEEKQFAQARAVLAQVLDARRVSGRWLPSVLAVASADGTLEQLIAAWKKQPNTAPDDSILRDATASLSEKDARAVRRFLYECALDRRELTAPNFLGLAAILLEDDDPAGAVELLKRLTLVSENMYADMDSAAQLLERQKKPAEALEFLRPLSDASPWNGGYMVRLAKAMLAANAGQTEALNTLAAVVADPKARYAERAAAAGALEGHGAPASGSDELKLLAQLGCPTLESVSKPFFVDARLRAANCISNAKQKERLLRDAIATAPSNSTVRLQYVWSAFAAGFDSRALLAASSYLNYDYAAGGFYGNSYTADDDGTGNARAAFAMADEASQDVTSVLALKSADAAKLYQLALAVYERRHDLEGSSRIIASALAIAHDPAQRKIFEDKQKQIATEQARASENDARVPNVHADLDQDRLVRPRLLPGMAVPQQPAKGDQE
jgi:predicted Zn-dependent protease